MSRSSTWPTWAHVGLNYDHPENLLTDQWGIKPEVYVTYRWAACFYLIGWLVASVIEFSGPKLKYVLNVTSWAFVVLTTTTLIRAVMITNFLRAGRPFYRMTCALRFVWVCENVSSVMALGVTIGYWSIINKDGNLPITGVTVHTHGVNAIYVVVDLLLTAKPYRLLHCWHGLLFSMIYLLFTAIYWALGGTGPTGEPFIYPSLDWRKPKTTLLFAFLFGCVLTFLMHAILCLLGVFRSWLYDRVVNRMNEKKKVVEEEKELRDVCGA